jgi:2-polyprenyl-3-methyl-5-hydroxy-6-metoxy-1,4-benzoquinol methylase
MAIRWAVCPMRKIAGYAAADKPSSAAPIIDLGCGHGLFTQLMARMHPTQPIIGIDLDAEKIKVAQQLTIPNLQFLCSDVMNADVPPAQSITILDVFYLLPYPLQEQLLQTCSDKLLPGGSLLLKDMAEKPRWKVMLNWLEEFLAVRVLKITDSIDGQFYFRPSSEWVALLTKLGFTVQTIPLDRGYYHPHILFVARKPL